MRGQPITAVAARTAAVILLSRICLVASMIIEIRNEIRHSNSSTLASRAQDASTAEDSLRIAIITLGHGPAVEDYAPNTLLINEIYAKRYNYAFIYGRPSTSEIRSSRRHVSWHKLRLALQVLEDNTFDYVMWMDLDAIFHNHWIRIEEMIAERPGADFYICTNNKEDLSNFPLGRVDRRIVVNCGVWIVRNSEWTRKFLLEWWNSAFQTGYGELRPWEQEALHSIWFGSGVDHKTQKEWLEISKHTAVFQYDRFNTASEQSVFSQHLSESFVFHCAAQTSANRHAIFEALAAEWRMRQKRAENPETVPGFLVSPKWMHQNLLKHFRRGTQMTKTNPTAHNRYGIALYNSGEFEKALSAFSSAAALDPNCVDAGDASCVNVHMNLGMTATRLKNSSIASSAYSIAFRNIVFAIMSGRESLHSWNVYQYEEMALGLFRGGKHLEAELALRLIEYPKTAVEMQPTASHVHYWMTRILTPKLGWPVLTDRSDEALQHIETALKIEPENKNFLDTKRLLMKP